MIVYFAESRTAGGLAEPVYQDDVSIAPTLSELSVNRTPSENNAVPMCTAVQNCMSNHMLTTLSEPSVNLSPSESNAVPMCTLV